MGALAAVVRKRAGDDSRAYGSVCLQLQPPVRRWCLIHEKLVAAWRELYTRGRASEQPYSVLLSDVLMMDMPPEYASNPGVVFEYVPQAAGILEAAAVDPGAAYRYRLVVQTEQDMAILGTGEQ